MKYTQAKQSFNIYDFRTALLVTTPSVSITRKDWCCCAKTHMESFSCLSLKPGSPKLCSEGRMGHFIAIEFVIFFFFSLSPPPPLFFPLLLLLSLWKKREKKKFPDENMRECNGNGMQAAASLPHLTVKQPRAKQHCELHGGARGRAQVGSGSSESLNKL